MPRVRTWQSISTAIFLPLFLAGCPSADNPTCSSAPVSHPGGQCSAYYYQTDYGSGGVTTQAITDCVVGSQRLGGGIVAFHTVKHGIGLRWLSANNLEVSVPDGVKMGEQRSGDVYASYPLAYTYRNLRPDDPEFAGCKPKRPAGGT